MGFGAEAPTLSVWDKIVLSTVLLVSSIYYVWLRFSAVASGSPTFSLLHHGAGLREGEALHGLVALHPWPVLAGPPARGELGQHATFEGVALLPRSLAAPGSSVRGWDRRRWVVKNPQKLEWSDRFMGMNRFGYGPFSDGCVWGP